MYDTGCASRNASVKAKIEGEALAAGEIVTDPVEVSRGIWEICGAIEREVAEERITLVYNIGLHWLHPRLILVGLEYLFDQVSRVQTEDS